MNFKLPRVVMKLYKMRVITTPNIQRGGFEPSYKVFCKYTEFYNSIKHKKPEFIKGDTPHSDFIPVFDKNSEYEEESKPQN